MTILTSNHPALCYTRELYNICRPLQILKITYFAHVNVDQNGHLSILANNQTSRTINQTYLNNIDLLKVFISEFNKTVKQSPLLSKAYHFKFLPDDNAAGYTTQQDELFDHMTQRSQFYKTLKKENQDNHSIQSIILPQQQMRCLSLLNKGMTSKEIAKQLNISPRTVEQHLSIARESMGCRNSKELIVRCREMMLCYD